MSPLDPPFFAPTPAWAMQLPPKRRSRPLLRWVWRGAKAGLVLVLCIAGGLTWRSGRIDALAARGQATGITLLARCGFKVEDVYAAGRMHVDRATLLATGGIKFGDPIFGFSPEAVRERIETLPWVASAAVERRLPGTVAITIVERKPIALWQHNGHFSMIDATGANLGPAVADTGQGLPQIVGGDAPPHAAELIDLLAQHPDLQKRVESSSWIGSRRWDLKLDNGIVVMLPEAGIGEALQALADAEASSRLLERDVAVIDFCVTGQMIVRLAHEPVVPKAARPQQRI